MHHQTSRRVQLSWTMPTLEVFRLLMLQENYSVQVAESCQFEVDVQDDWIWNVPFSSSNSLSQYQHHGFKV